MLKKIKVSDLKNGDRYSAPIFFDDGENMLLAKGIPVTDYEIDMLKNWRVQYVVTAGELIPEGEEVSDDEFGVLTEEDELIEELGEEFIEELPKEEFAIKGTRLTNLAIEEVSIEDILKVDKESLSSKLYSTYLGIIINLDDIFKKIKAKKSIETMAFSKYAASIQDMTENDPAVMVNFILSSTFSDNNLARLAVNTAILTTVLCKELKLSEEQTYEIVIAALLHDIGMTRIPEKVLNKNEDLSDAEMQTIAAHTGYGYKIAVTELMYTNNIGLSVMQHHERWDGKGYPNNIGGEQINLGARIISVADAFIAMITPKPYRKLMLGYQAMKNLLADNSRRFDPVIIKAMIRSIGIYPIGSMVLLNNASLARVVKCSPEALMRPFIKILIDESGQPVTGNAGIVDLKEKKNLFIVRPIDPRMYRT